MELKELILERLPLIKKHWFPLSLGILGLMLFVLGLIGLLKVEDKANEDIVFEASAEQNGVKRAVEIQSLMVDVEGAVEKPGVYRLPLDSRIQDALVAAGGLSAKADRDYLAKNFNLAIKLTDGSKVYVPFVGEAVSSSQVLNASSEKVNLSGLININTATEAQLDSLPGVGPVTAQKIISARPYSLIDELISKKIVSRKVFDQIKEKISVY